MNEMFMEDVGSIASETVDLVSSKLEEFGQELKDEDSDKIFDFILSVVEKYCPNDYKFQM